MSKECYLQEISNKCLEPFISVQENNLTFDPKMLVTPLNQPKIMMYGDEEIDITDESSILSFVYGVCRQCNLCRSRINASTTRVEIDREGYTFESDNESLFPYTSTSFASDGKSTGKIAIVEDSPNGAFELAKYLNRHGKYVVVYIVQPRTTPFTFDETHGLVDILLHNHFQAVIMDKGIGPCSGLDLALDIASLRKSGESTPKTIMISGEPGTDESHRAMPDVFFTKSHFKGEQLLEAINTPFIVRD